MTKRGRPTKQPTAQERAKVSELLANDAPLSDIAKLLGYSLPTLRKYFQSEIFSGKKIKQPEKPVRVVTSEQREKVKRYVGCKMPLRKIAFALGYEAEDDFTAFQSDFAREIEIGDAVYRAKVLDQLDKQMVGGVAGATNKLEALTQIIEPGEASQAQTPGYVGKKGAAAVAASDVAANGGKFAPRTPPRLVANGGQRVDPKPKG